MRQTPTHIEHETHLVHTPLSTARLKQRGIEVNVEALAVPSRSGRMVPLFLEAMTYLPACLSLSQQYHTHTHIHTNVFPAE